MYCNLIWGILASAKLPVFISLVTVNTTNSTRIAKNVMNYQRTYLHLSLEDHNSSQNMALILF